VLPDLRQMHRIAMQQLLGQHSEAQQHYRIAPQIVRPDLRQLD
jgi:hypothetical protein